MPEKEEMVGKVEEAMARALDYIKPNGTKSEDALRFSQVSWSTLHGISRLIIDGIYADSAAIEPICENAAEMFWRELAP